MNITIVSRRGFFAATVAGPAAIRLFAAQDFWNRKPASQWSGQEVQSLVKNSPWAKEVRVEFKAATRGGYAGGSGLGMPAEPERQTNVIQVPGQTEMPIPGGAAGPGGVGNRTNIPGGQMGDALGGRRAPDGTPLAAATAMVRWENAQPLLDTLHTPIPPEFAERYIISIIGIPALTGRDFLPSEADMVDRLKASARLDAKSLGGSQAGAIRRTPTAMWFGFAKEFLPLTVEDRDVVFTLSTEQLRLSAKFEPKDMLYRGKLAV